MGIRYFAEPCKRDTVMALLSAYVFKTRDLAVVNEPPKGKTADKFRLYEVSHNGNGEMLWVWERNPVVASGRAAEKWGIVATPVKTVAAPRSASDLSAMLSSLSEAERAKFLAEIAKRK